MSRPRVPSRSPPRPISPSPTPPLNSYLPYPHTHRRTPWSHVPRPGVAESEAVDRSWSEREREQSQARWDRQRREEEEQQAERRWRQRRKERRDAEEAQRYYQQQPVQPHSPRLVCIGGGAPSSYTAASLIGPSSTGAAAAAAAAPPPSSPSIAQLESLNAEHARHASLLRRQSAQLLEANESLQEQLRVSNARAEEAQVKLEEERTRAARAEERAAKAEQRAEEALLRAEQSDARVERRSAKLASCKAKLAESISAQRAMGAESAALRTQALDMLDTLHRQFASVLAQWGSHMRSLQQGAAEKDREVARLQERMGAYASQLTSTQQRLASAIAQSEQRRESHRRGASDERNVREHAPATPTAASVPTAPWGGPSTPQPQRESAAAVASALREARSRIMEATLQQPAPQPQLVQPVPYPQSQPEAHEPAAAPRARPAWTYPAPHGHSSSTAGATVASSSPSPSAPSPSAFSAASSGASPTPRALTHVHAADRGAMEYASEQPMREREQPRRRDTGAEHVTHHYQRRAGCAHSPSRCQCRRRARSCSGERGSGRARAATDRCSPAVASCRAGQHPYAPTCSCAAPRRNRSVSRTRARTRSAPRARARTRSPIPSLRSPVHLASSAHRRAICPCDRAHAYACGCVPPPRDYPSFLATHGSALLHTHASQSKRGVAGSGEQGAHPMRSVGSFPDRPSSGARRFPVRAYVDAAPHYNPHATLATAGTCAADAAAPGSSLSSSLKRSHVQPPPWLVAGTAGACGATAGAAAPKATEPPTPPQRVKRGATQPPPQRKPVELQPPAGKPTQLEPDA